eukprot:s3829_g7.t1
MGPRSKHVHAMCWQQGAQFMSSMHQPVVVPLNPIQAGKEWTLKVYSQHSKRAILSASLLRAGSDRKRSYLEVRNNERDQLLGCSSQLQLTTLSFTWKLHLTASLKFCKLSLFCPSFSIWGSGLFHPAVLVAIQMMLDQWDWKTSAPEFVPGSLQSGSSPSNAPPAVARPVTAPGPTAPPRPLGTAVFGPVVGACFAPMTESNGMCMPPMSHGMCAAPGGPTGGYWHQGFQSYDMPPSRPQSMQEPIFGKESWEEEEDYAERIRAAQVQARYEMQLRSKEEELRSLQDRLNRKEDETARMQADFERDRQGLLYNLNQLSHAVAEKKVQDRYDNRGDKGGYRREKGNREASERNYSGQGFPGGKEHRFGVERKSSMVSKPRRDDVAPPPDVRPRRAPPAAGMSAVGAWSGARLEKFVRQTPGAMELRPHHAADGSTSWTLKLCMDELTPPLNDEGMQVFCRWLHHTFQLMREQHQIRSMQMVWAEVSLAWNQMGDDAVGRLLQALQRSQLRVRTLKFRGNGIGSAGGAWGALGQ